MLVAHHRSRQSWIVAALVGALAFAGCAAEELRPTIWPPADFRIEVEESQDVGGHRVVGRRFVVDAAGVAVYATATAVVAAPDAAVALPVLDRLCSYRLVPECVRSLARKLHRLGIGTLEDAPAEAPASRLSLRWRAFGDARDIRSGANVEWALGEILALLSAHLPPGEPAFAGVDPARKVEPAIDGAPAPAVDPAAGAFWRERAAARPGDEGAWAAAFADACRRGVRREANDLLQQWQQAAGAAAGSRIAECRRLLPPTPAN